METSSSSLEATTAKSASTTCTSLTQSKPHGGSPWIPSASSRHPAACMRPQQRGSNRGNRHNSNHSRSNLSLKRARARHWREAPWLRETWYSRRRKKWAPCTNAICAEKHLAQKFTFRFPINSSLKSSFFGYLLAKGCGPKSINSMVFGFSHKRHLLFNPKLHQMLLFTAGSVLNYRGCFCNNDIKMFDQNSLFIYFLRSRNKT